jgi:hypothetical protein
MVTLEAARAGRLPDDTPGLPNQATGDLTTPRLDTPRHRGATKPFSQADEKVLKQRRPSLPVAQATGFGHVGRHHQPVLPSVLQSFLVRNSNAEASLGLIAVSNSPVGQTEAHQSPDGFRAFTVCRSAFCAVD